MINQQQHFLPCCFPRESLRNIQMPTASFPQLTLLNTDPSLMPACHCDIHVGGVYHFVTSPTTLITMPSELSMNHILLLH